MSDRSRELNMLNETLQILKQGYYVKNGRKVKLKLSRREMEEIHVYLPDDVRKYSNIEDFNPPYVIGRCGYGCENKDSFSLARERMKYTYLYDNDIPKILVLNLANPVNPGGGVRRGARAQEEDLCRSSSLLLSLECRHAKKYYDYNKSLNTYMGSDALMITPQVEIIRDENGELLDDTVVVSVVTCAAPLVSYGKEGMTDAEYEQMMYDRITGMLKCVAYRGYKNLVLGAWGCGAFGNDAAVISNLFYKALRELDYNGHSQKDLFRRIDFAVLDRTREQYNFKEFYRNFTHDNFYRVEKQRSIDEAMKRIKETEVNLDKIRGCFVGGAAGDALGYAVEFSREDEIFARYGKSGITEYEIDRLAGKAVISDDTQMTLFTANGLLVGDTRGRMRGIQGWPRMYVENAYQDWLRTQEMSFEESRKQRLKSGIYSFSWLLDVPELYKRRAPGMTCLSALKQGKIDGTDFIANHPNNSKGCGGVMRVAPLALNYNWPDIGQLDYEGAQIAAITHGHSLGYMPAAVLTHIINRIVFQAEEMPLKEIIKEAEQTTSELFYDDKHLGELINLIDLAVELSENGDSDLDNIHRLGEGWVAEETLAIAIYCALKYQDDFSAGIIAAVNHNGDSDSTGAVTGNILGALLGYKAIDDKWKTDLELHDVILEMADDICHGCQMSEYSDYNDPDWYRKYIGMHWKDEDVQPVDDDMSIEEFIQSPGFYDMNRMLREGAVSGDAEIEEGSETGMSSIEIRKIGITDLDTDCIVNAANSHLAQGSGVCGAIFRAAGAREMQAACDKIGHCPTGGAVITPGFALKAKYVIHAVGPIWQDGNHHEPQDLYSCYREALERARENGCHSIGFPLISAGIFGYPKDKAWRKALQSCSDWIEKNPDYDMKIIFAVLDDRILELGQKTMEELGITRK